MRGRQDLILAFRRQGTPRSLYWCNRHLMISALICQHTQQHTCVPRVLLRFPPIFLVRAEPPRPCSPGAVRYKIFPIERFRWWIASSLLQTADAPAAPLMLERVFAVKLHMAVPLTFSGQKRSCDVTTETAQEPVWGQYWSFSGLFGRLATSTKQVMWQLIFICLSAYLPVCLLELFLSNILEAYVDNGPRNRWAHFGDVSGGTLTPKLRPDLIRQSYVDMHR